MVKARVRTDAQRRDACILNISSRGLLIQSQHAPPRGSAVQVMRGDHLILARVVWSSRGRAGLQSDDQLPVDEILSLEQSQALQLIATNGVLHDRRRDLRQGCADHARVRARAIEFAAIGAIGAALALSAWGMAAYALERPLARVSSALGG